MHKIFIDQIDVPINYGLPTVSFKFSECEKGFFIRTNHKVEKGFRKPVIRVGCGKCDICKNEALERKQMKWVQRLSAMTEEYDVNRGHMIQWHVVTMSPEDYVPLKQFRGQVKRMLKALSLEMKRSHGVTFKYVVTYEGSFDEKNRYGNVGSDTRLHGNIILFIDSDDPEVYRAIESYCKDYWYRNNFRVHPEHGYKVSRVFNSGVDCYITKYISKESQTTRIMSSQFGWSAFMKDYNLKWLGLKEGDKVRRWAVYDGTGLKRLRALVNKSKQAQSTIRMSDSDALKFVARPKYLFTVEKSVPSDRFLTLDSGYKIWCKDNECLEKLKHRRNLLIVPENLDWSRHRNSSGLAAHWYDLVIQFNYRRSVFMDKEEYDRRMRLGMAAMEESASVASDLQNVNRNWEGYRK